MSSDDELLRAWRAGDRRAGDQLIQNHFDPICRFFRTKLGDDVEDLIQRTFLDLLEAAERTSIESVRATLFTIAHRRLLDHLRMRYNRPVEQLTSLSVADLGTSPSAAVGRGEEQRLLHEAMRRVSLEHQVALELAYWEELSGPEIAAILGISENTVRSRLARARAALREEIDKLARTPALAESTLTSVFSGSLGRAARLPQA
jgi:RNA polymerase sigma factor (sigma-70 family)